MVPFRAERGPVKFPPLDRDPVEFDHPEVALMGVKTVECPWCGQQTALYPTSPDRMQPHKSKETKGLCGGSDLEWKDPIL